MGTADIGAYEVQGFTISLSGGNNQTTGIGTAFASGLTVTVTGSGADPVNGGFITFTAPGSGASLNPATNTATVFGGSASLAATANGIIGGPYTVAATALGSSSTVNFSLANTTGPATHFTVATPASANAGSAFSFTVTALDAFENTVTGYAGTVHFMSTDGASALPADSTLTNGVGTFSATLNAPGNQTITATDTITSSITGTSGATNVTSADLSITMTDGVTTATPGGSVTYTITVSNTGPSNVTGATVADTFPASLTATWTGVGAGGGTATASGSGNINDTVNLPAGGSVTYTVSATISAGATGTLSNTATVSSSVTDPTPGNNSATDSDTLTPQADLAITKTDGVTVVNAGGTVTYTITASNAGPSNAPGTTVADTLPASLSNVAWTAVGAGGGTVTASGSGNINDTVNLPAGGSVTYTVTADISGSASGTLSNTATVSAPGGVTDPTPGNNSATDSDLVNTAPIVANPTSENIAATKVTLGGEVTGDGGLPVTVRGVVYSLTSTNADPVIGGNGVTNLTTGGTTGVFIVNVTGLIPNSGYSFKAYATNSIGTNYSSPASTFTTLTAPEIAIEQPAGTDLTAGTASIGFGTVNLGSSVTKTFTIKNSGSAVLNITSASTTGGQAGDFVVNTGGMLNSVPSSGLASSPSLPIFNGGTLVNGATLNLGAGTTSYNGGYSGGTLSILQPYTGIPNNIVSGSSGTFSLVNGSVVRVSTQTGSTVRSGFIVTMVDGTPRIVTDINQWPTLQSGTIALFSAQNGLLGSTLNFAGINTPSATNITTPVAEVPSAIDANAPLLSSLTPMVSPPSGGTLVVNGSNTYTSGSASGTLTLNSGVAGTNIGTFFTSGQTTFTVTFTPVTAGAKQTTLRVVTDDEDESTFDIALTGTGNALPTLTLPASPVLAETTVLSGTTVDFTVTANDAEDGALTPTVTPPSGSNFPRGDTTVNVSATDSNGAVVTGSFVVRVQLTTPVNTPTLAKGDAAPGAGTNGLPADAKLSTFGMPAIDEDGNIAFVATWTSATSGNGTGLFTNAACIALVGAPVPGVSGAKYKGFSDPVIDGGRIASIITMTGVPAISSSAVLTANTSDDIEIVARAGDVATTDGAKFKSFKSVEVRGLTIAFAGKLITGTGTPKATIASDEGVWVKDLTSSLVLALREGQTVGERKIKTLTAFDSSIGSRGQGRGWLELTGSAATVQARVIYTDTTQAAIRAKISDTNVDVTTLLHNDDVFTDGRQLTGAFGLPAVNAAGKIALRASTASDRGARPGIEVNLDGSDYTRIAARDQSTPGSSNFFSTLQDPVLAEDGSVAFPAKIRGTGIKGASANTLWWQPVGGSLTLLARGGAINGGAQNDLPSGAQWSAFNSLAIAADRGPIFSASLVVGKGGVTSANSKGVWAMDYQGKLQHLFRTGETINGKKLKNFTLLNATAGNAGVTRSFSDNMQVVWLATFTDASQAVITTQVP